MLCVRYGTEAEENIDDRFLAGFAKQITGDCKLPVCDISTFTSDSFLLVRYGEIHVERGKTRVKSSRIRCFCCSYARI